MVTICTTSSTLQELRVLTSALTFSYFIWISEQTAITFLTALTDWSFEPRSRELRWGKKSILNIYSTTLIVHISERGVSTHKTNNVHVIVTRVRVTIVALEKQ